MAFLALCSYSRHDILSNCDTAAPLCKCILENGSKNLSAALDWTIVAETAVFVVFFYLKTEMAKATTVAIPEYYKPFHLDVDEKNAVVNAVLFQNGEETTKKLQCST